MWDVIGVFVEGNEQGVDGGVLGCFAIGCGN